MADETRQQSAASDKTEADVDRTVSNPSDGGLLLADRGPLVEMAASTSVEQAPDDGGPLEESAENDPAAAAAPQPHSDSDSPPDADDSSGPPTPSSVDWKPISPCAFLRFPSAPLARFKCAL